MDNNKERNELVRTMMEVECYPIGMDEEVRLDKYMKLSLSRIPALGTAFEPLALAFQKIIPGIPGQTSTLCRVTIPNGTHLAKFRDGGGHLGTVLNNRTNQIAGQARLNPLVCNPTTLFMAAALMSIDKKLESIMEAQQEIIDFLEQKEKSRLRGNLIFLTDVMNNYKHNWTNEKYMNSNHIKVLDIKQDSEQSILFYREKIERRVKKQIFLHRDKDISEKIKTIQAEFKEYQLALYLFSFSSFLEVMLLENFESAFLDCVVQKIEEYSYQYRELYTNCYDRIEGDSKSSVQSHLLKGLTSINKAAGGAVAKIPVVSKTQMDETLLETSSRLEKFSSKRTKKTMEQLANTQSSSVRPFIDNINTIKILYSQPMEIIIDEENIYLLKCS